jgi:hypothetical protein
MAPSSALIVQRVEVQCHTFRISLIPFNLSQEQLKIFNSKHTTSKCNKWTAFDCSSERYSKNDKVIMHPRQVHSIQNTLDRC